MNFTATSLAQFIHDEEIALLEKAMNMASGVLKELEGWETVPEDIKEIKTLVANKILEVMFEPPKNEHRWKVNDQNQIICAKCDLPQLQTPPYCTFADPIA